MSQFEREIKQLLENYEAPVDNSAWSGMERKLSGSSTSFFKQFVVAGSILTVAMIGLSVDYNTSNESNSSHQLAEASNNTSVEISSVDIAQDHLENIQKGDTKNISEDLINSDQDTQLNEDLSRLNGDLSENNMTDNSSNKTNAVESYIESKNISTENLSDLEKENLIGINESIKDKADKKSPVTEYVGENFNLNANMTLTPNGDNKNDVFLPDALVEADNFIMKIFDQDGAMIFSSSSLENPWTGYNQVTGNQAENGKYRWKVTLDNNNRREIFTGKIVVKN